MVSRKWNWRMTFLNPLETYLLSRMFYKRRARIVRALQDADRAKGSNMDLSLLRAELDGLDRLIVRFGCVKPVIAGSFWARIGSLIRDKFSYR